MSHSIYLDNNATTHLDVHVAQRMHELNLAGISNPASQHAPGRQALHLLEEAKSQILEYVGASLAGVQADQVILTSGGTEANNLAIFGAYAAKPGTIIVGGTDHPSVIEAAKAACKSAGECRILPVDSNGLCDLNLLREWLVEITSAGRHISLVSIMLGNNETGVVQDLKSVAALCAEFQTPVHSDIVQAVGKVPFSMIEYGLSSITLTAHKIHGPVGIGALVSQQSFQFHPLVVGGGQQLGLRAGTEPVVPAVGLAAALELICHAQKAGKYDFVEQLRDRFEQRITELCDCSVVASQAPRLPHTSNISFADIDRQALHMSLDLKGLACSTGSACSSGSGRPSGSLVAMSLPDSIVQGALRFSFSRYSTEDEVENAVSIISGAIERCRASSF